MRSTGKLRGRSPSDTGTRARSTSGGRGVRSRQRARCCFRSSWTILRGVRNSSRPKRIRTKSGSGVRTPAELVRWENTTNEPLLEAARAEIRESWRRACSDNADHPEAATLFDPERLPAFHDPFAGGGAIPLEAQRLGMEAHASDLNPVAVLINKAMIEVPPRFAGRPPVHPTDGKNLTAKGWKGAAGLAEDVRHYGSGCGTRRSGGSATCIRRSTSRRRWCANGRT